MLLNNDFSDRIYECWVVSEVMVKNHVLYGEAQCLFDINGAEIVKSWTIKDFYDTFKHLKSVE